MAAAASSCWKLGESTLVCLFSLFISGMQDGRHADLQTLVIRLFALHHWVHNSSTLVPLEVSSFHCSVIYRYSLLFSSSNINGSHHQFIDRPLLATMINDQCLVGSCCKVTKTHNMSPLLLAYPDIRHAKMVLSRNSCSHLLQSPFIPCVLRSFLNMEITNDPHYIALASENWLTVPNDCCVCWRVGPFDRLIWFEATKKTFQRNMGSN